MSGSVSHTEHDADRIKTLLTCQTDSHFRMQWRADSRGFYFRQRLNKTQPYSTFYMDLTAGQPSKSLYLLPILQMVILLQRLHQITSNWRLLTTKLQHRLSYSFWQIPAYQRQYSHQVELAVRQLHWLDPNHLLLVTDKKVYRYHIPSQIYHPVLAEKNYINSLALSESRWFVGVSEQNSDILRASLPQSCEAGTRQRVYAAATPVVQSSRLDLLPRMSPDGRSLAFLSDRQGRRQLMAEAGDCGSSAGG
jgi:transcriptional activator of cad operon